MDTKALGITTLCLSQSSFTTESQFYIARPNQSNHDMILGRAWMRKTRCSIDWDTNSVKLIADNKRVTLPMVMETSKAQTIEQESEQKSVLFIKGTHDHEASTSNASVLPATNKAVLAKLICQNRQCLSHKSCQLFKTRTLQNVGYLKRFCEPKDIIRAQNTYGSQKQNHPYQQLL